MEEPCNHTSVGIIVWRDDKLMLIERAVGTKGYALPAGHVDEGESYEHAAARELAEEVGLNATELVLVAEGKKDNPCSRGSSWHYWKIYTAKAEGEIVRSKEETKRAGWYSKDEIKKLPEPGLEPVMQEWFTALQLLA